MEHFSDDLLIETYLKAKDLHLSEDFVNLLYKYIQHRGISDEEIIFFINRLDRKYNSSLENHAKF